MQRRADGVRLCRCCMYCINPLYFLKNGVIFLKVIALDAVDAVDAAFTLKHLPLSWS